MSALTEQVVREYFEMQGFLVSQPRKYSVPGRPKKPDEELDLIVVNPTVNASTLPERLIWTTADLQGVARAIVGVRGWHTDRFYPSMIEQTPELLRFLQPQTLRVAGALLGAEPIARILCLPRLPASGALRNQTIRLLKEHGVDGVIGFRTILETLVAGVDANKHYEKSDTLQLIRLLKNYDLVRDRQMDLFAPKRARRRTPGRPAGEKEAGPSANGT